MKPSVCRRVAMTAVADITLSGEGLSPSTPGTKPWGLSATFVQRDTVASMLQGKNELWGQMAEVAG